MAGQVTTFFGYSRGLNGALVAKPFDAPEMRNKQAVSSTRGIIGRIVDDGTCERVAVTPGSWITGERLRKRLCA